MVSQVDCFFCCAIFINKVLLGYSPAHLLLYCLGLPLTLRKTIQPVKLKTFSIWRFTGSSPTPVLALMASRELRPRRCLDQEHVGSTKVMLMLSRGRRRDPTLIPECQRDPQERKGKTLAIGSCPRQPQSSRSQGTPDAHSARIICTCQHQQTTASTLTGGLAITIRG